MLRKTIKFLNFDDEEETEVHYFNLSKVEIFDWEAETDGGLHRLFEKLVETKDGSVLYNLVKDFVMRTYGIKSEDGKKFIKNNEVREAFKQTPAYDALIIEIATDDEAAFKFITGVLPKDVRGGMNDLKNMSKEDLIKLLNKEQKSDDSESSEEDIVEEDTQTPSTT